MPRLLASLIGAVAPRHLVQYFMSTVKYASARKYLLNNETSPSGDASQTSDVVGEYIVGFGLQMRLSNGQLKKVPPTLKTRDVEVMHWVALSSHGEWDGSLWYSRYDAFIPGLVDMTDERKMKVAALKKTWTEVDKTNLPNPLFAPCFPKSAGYKDSWDALILSVLEEHNKGNIPGFISTGAGFGTDLNVYPTLEEIRRVNLCALKSTMHTTSCPRLHPLPCYCHVGLGALP